MDSIMQMSEHRNDAMEGIIGEQVSVLEKQDASEIMSAERLSISLENIKSAYNCQGKRGRKFFTAQQKCINRLQNLETEMREGEDSRVEYLETLIQAEQNDTKLRLHIASIVRVNLITDAGGA